MALPIVDVNAYYKESSIVANPVRHNLICELAMCDDDMPLHRCTREGRCLLNLLAKNSELIPHLKHLLQQLYFSFRLHPLPIAGCRCTLPSVQHQRQRCQGTLLPVCAMSQPMSLYEHSVYAAIVWSGAQLLCGKIDQALPEGLHEMRGRMRCEL